MNRWLEELEDQRCVFCKSQNESISHLLFRCTFVNSVWRRVRSWLKINKNMSTLQSCVKWIKEHRGALVRSKEIILAFAATIYTVWNTRNKLMFVGVPAVSDDILLTVKAHVYTVLYNLYPFEVVHL